MILKQSPLITLLFSLLGEKRWQIIALTGFAGLLHALLVVIIGAASGSLTQGSTFFFRFFVMFLVCVVGYTTMLRLTSRKVIGLLGEWIYTTQRKVAGQLMRSRLTEFERLERARLYKSLIENTDLLMDATRMMVQASSGLVMVVVSMAYIFTLSQMAFFLTVIITGAAAFMYSRKQGVINTYTSKFKKMEKLFLCYLDHILNGIKELKVNRSRRADLYDKHMYRANQTAQRIKVKAERMTVENYIFAETFLLVLIASVVFVLPRFIPTNSETVLVLCMAILYVLGPLGQVIGAVPLIFKADWAIKDMNELCKMLDDYDETKEFDPDGRLARRQGHFDRIEFMDVEFCYPSAATNGHGFRVQPSSFTLKRGELVFLVGGNGSGKSTFLKLLTGLYFPDEGAILVDDIPVNETNREAYREMFSVLFADFHLFDRLYGLADLEQAEVTAMLERMGIADKTGVCRGKFTTLDLSSGQKKRLALAVCLLEDSPVYILDEVAADLDPEFRKHFYEDILPELKAKGKTVVAVSHDDRYFHAADRVVRMDYGSMEPVVDEEAG